MVVDSKMLKLWKLLGCPSLISRDQQRYSRRWASWSHLAEKHGNCKSPFYLEIHLQMCTWMIFQGIQQPDSLLTGISHLLQPHFCGWNPNQTDSTDATLTTHWIPSRDPSESSYFDRLQHHHRLKPTSLFLEVVLMDKPFSLEMCHITCRILPAKRNHS